MGLYSDRLKLSMPDPGACNWHPDWYRNQQINDAVNTQVMEGNFTVSGGNFSGVSGLNINIDETVVSVDGTEHTISAATLSLTGATTEPDQINWVYVDDAGVLQVSVVPPTGSFALLQLIDTNTTTTIRQADLRQSELGGGSSTPVDNVIINGDLSGGVRTINQRAFDGNWSLLSVGAFGYDRWRKSSTTNKIIQPVREGNYTPNGTYYLFGTGVTATGLTAPASGIWEIEVPDTATMVYLVEGVGVLPVRQMSVEETLNICLSYCWVPNPDERFYASPQYNSTTNLSRRMVIFLPTTMIQVPHTRTFVGSAGWDPALAWGRENAVIVTGTADTATTITYLYEVLIDAEI